MKRLIKGTLKDYYLNYGERLNSFSSRLEICNLTLMQALYGFPSLSEEEIYKLISYLNPSEENIHNFLKLKKIGGINGQ